MAIDSLAGFLPYLDDIRQGTPLCTCRTPHSARLDASANIRRLTHSLLHPHTKFKSHHRSDAKKLLKETAHNTILADVRDLFGATTQGLRLLQSRRLQPERAERRLKFYKKPN